MIRTKEECGDIEPNNEELEYDVDSTKKFKEIKVYECLEWAWEGDRDSDNSEAEEQEEEQEYE